MDSTDLASTTGAFADTVAKRLADDGIDIELSLMVIGDEGVEERRIPGTAGTVDVRFEMVEDVAGLLGGNVGLSGLVYVGRAALDGPAEAVNTVAPAVGFSGHRFMPYVTRAKVLSDADLQEMLSEEGVPSLLRRSIEANSFAYNVIDLASHIGDFRTRWRVGEHELDSISDADGIHIADHDPTAEIGCTVTYHEPLAWMRWLGTTCAPPPTEAEAAHELTFLDALLAGKFTMEGNTQSLEAVARLLPNSR